VRGEIPSVMASSFQFLCLNQASNCNSEQTYFCTHST